MNRLEEKYGKNFTVQEIAEFLRIDIRTARRKCRKIDGAFKTGRKTLIPEKSFEKYLQHSERLKNDTELASNDKDALNSLVDKHLKRGEFV